MNGADYEVTSPDSVFALLKAAKDQATITIKTGLDKPHPDIHLLNLWESRLVALRRYREHGKTHTLRARLNIATMEAKKYCKKLSLERWQDLCNQFNGLMHVSTV